MKSFNEWIKENFQEQDPDWWKDKDQDQKDELRRSLEKSGVSPEEIEDIINHAKFGKGSSLRDRMKGRGYASNDSYHKTPNSVPMNRRKEMEEIYDYQQRILDIANKTSREKLLNILKKIKPNKDFSSSRENHDLGVHIFTYYPTHGTPEGYKQLMEFLKKELIVI
jgi:hypothetical protein